MRSHGERWRRTAIAALRGATMLGMRTAMVLPFLAACGAASHAPPYAGDGPIAHPRIFAPGAVSTADPEFAISALDPRHSPGALSSES